MAHKRRKGNKGDQIAYVVPFSFEAHGPRFHSTSKLMRSGGNGPNDGISVANFRAGAVMKHVRGGRGVFNARFERPETKLYNTPTGSHGANVETRKGYGVQLDRAKALTIDGRTIAGKVTRKQRLAKRG